jgi:hypothetical protein
MSTFRNLLGALALLVAAACTGSDAPSPDTARRAAAVAREVQAKPAAAAAAVEAGGWSVADFEALLYDIAADPDAAAAYTAALQAG